MKRLFFTIFIQLLLFPIAVSASVTDLTPLITKGSQLSSNASDAQEGLHIEYLIDGDASTFWHSDWHSPYNSNNPHYVQVQLSSTFQGNLVLHLVRRNTPNDHPTRMRITGSKDGTSWTEIAMLAMPFDGAGTPCTSEVFAVKESVRYLRATALDCSSSEGVSFRGFWHSAELQFYVLEGQDVQRLMLDACVSKYEKYLHGEAFDIGTNVGQFADAQAVEEFMEALSQADELLRGSKPMPSNEEVRALVDRINRSYEAIMASEVRFKFQDGYYRIIANVNYYTFDASGKKQYVTKGMYSSHTGYGCWGTLDERNLSFVWRLTQKTGGIEMLNMGTGMQFKDMSVPVTMSTTASTLMAFDHVGTENGHAILYIRSAATEKNNDAAIYLHQWYHQLGAGSGHEMCVWLGTFNKVDDKGTSEWYITPLSEEEIASIDGVTDKITLSHQELQMEQGESFSMSYTLTPDNNRFNKISWWSDNSSVATVDETGRIYAIGVGSTIVHAKSNDRGGAMAQCVVKVTRTPATAQSLIINEIQSANIDQFMDPSWNFGGWIELYNASDHAINISDFWISDDADHLKKHRIHSQVGMIPAHGYRNLWFDHCNEDYPTQIDFKLNVEGGNLYISDEKGKLIVSQNYPPAISRCSYARKKDGGADWGLTSTPTPMAGNAGSLFASERMEAPQVNLNSQLFTAPLNIRVDIPQGATLRYTTDGSTPTLQNGNSSLTGTFMVARTTVYRFCLFQEGYLPSRVVTRSYIYKDKEYDLPIVSIATKAENVWGQEYGIFAKGENGKPGNGQGEKCNWNMDWDRPVNVEYFDSEGNLLINQEASFSASGGWSRAWEPHSIELKASKMYELENTFNAPLLPTKPFNKYKVFKLRNGGNDHTCRIKDAALQEIVRTSGLYVDTQGYYPVCHFINGNYMGTLNFREPNNKNYGYSNYGYDTDEMDQFEVSPEREFGMMVGDREAWDRIRQLSQNSADPVAYEQVKQLLDIDEFINYMAVEFYIGANDWTSNNVKGFRSRDPEKDGRYHIVMFDTDDALSNQDPFKRYEGFNGTFAMVFKWLLRNPDFVKQFIDTYCLVAGSVYEPTRVKEIVSAMAARVEKMQSYPSHYEVAGSSPWGTANTIISTFENSSRRSAMMNALRNYAPFGLLDKTGQHVKLSSNVEQAKILLNGMDVPTGRFDGTLFSPIQLEAKAPTGYTFLGWGSDESNDRQLFEQAGSWKYYDKGSLDGKVWKSKGYVDASWSLGKAPLGYGSASTGYNTTLNYGDDASNKTPTYYFRKQFRLEKVPSPMDQFQLTFLADDGFVVYINGIEAGRYQMPAGEIEFGSLATTYAGSDPNQGVLVLDSKPFREGDNVIAVEVHNSSMSSSDIYWDASLTMTSHVNSGSFVSKDPIYTLPEKGNLNLVAVYAETSQEELLANGATPVRINEISGANDRYVNDLMKKSDWIELYNTTSDDIDLAGMYITDNLAKPQKYQIPEDDRFNTVIPAHGFMVLWADKKEAVSQLHTGFELAKDGGDVMLTSADGTWRDVLHYPAHTSEQSVGLYPDGGDLVYMMSKPTLMTQNMIGSYTLLFGERENPNGISLPQIGIAGENHGQIMSVEFYNLSGSRIPSPQPGVNIVKRTYSDGQILTQKALY